MKLKTIDDIDWKEQGHVDSVDIINNDTLRNFKIALYPSSFKKIIRQEAIKWVKEMDKCSDGRGFFCLVHSQDSKECENDKRIDTLECDLICDAPYESTDIMAIIQFIKLFFNITEEELK